jgi:membrane protein
MSSKANNPGKILWQTVKEFLSDSCPQMAAALSYYTVFSLPPLLVLLMLVAMPGQRLQHRRSVLSGR